MMKRSKAQSTLEYVVLVTAVIVVILALVGSKDSAFRKTMNSTLNSTTEMMGTAIDKWSSTTGN